MDEARFAAVTRALADVSSRRGLLRLAAALAGAGSFATPRWGEATARGKPKHRAKRRRHAGQPSPCPPSPPPPPRLIATYLCPGPSSAQTGGPDGMRFAQTFRPAQNGELRQVEFSVLNNEAAGDFVVQLLQVSGGIPGHSPGDVLAEVTVPDASVAIGDGAAVVATLAGPPLVAGTEYAAAIHRPGTGSGQWAVKGRTGDSNACGGKKFSALGAEAFTGVATEDLLISVLVV
jgi:hypothetical protein